MLIMGLLGCKSRPLTLELESPSDPKSLIPLEKPSGRATLAHEMTKLRGRPVRLPATFATKNSNLRKQTSTGETLCIDGMILRRDVPLSSSCEHGMLAH